MKTIADKAWESLKLTDEMRCDKSFSPILCKKCDYYYVEGVDYNIAHCLKQNIRNWTLYRISKGE